MKRGHSKCPSVQELICYIVWALMHTQSNFVNLVKSDHPSNWEQQTKLQINSFECTQGRTELFVASIVCVLRNIFKMAPSGPALSIAQYQEFNLDSTLLTIGNSTYWTIFLAQNNKDTRQHSSCQFKVHRELSKHMCTLWINYIQ